MLQNTLVATFAFVLFLGGCGSTPPGARTRTPSPSASRDTGIKNARIILYTPRASITMILVNKVHEKRRTAKGRLWLTNGRVDQAYKAMDDHEIDALLKSFPTFNHQIIKSPWNDEDAHLLRATTDDIPGYKGVILVENAGQRYKLLGRRPSTAGDSLGVARLKAFSQIKTLVSSWYNSVSIVEFPQASSGGNRRNSLTPDP